jgi:hypothetical protein
LKSCNFDPISAVRQEISCNVIHRVVFPRNKIIRNRKIEVLSMTFASSTTVEIAAGSMPFQEASAQAVKYVTPTVSQGSGRQQQQQKQADPDAQRISRLQQSMPKHLNYSHR